MPATLPESMYACKPGPMRASAASDKPTASGRAVGRARLTEPHESTSAAEAAITAFTAEFTKVTESWDSILPGEEWPASRPLAAWTATDRPWKNLNLASTANVMLFLSQKQKHEAHRRP